MRTIAVTLIFLVCGIQTTIAQSVDRYWWNFDGVKAQWYSQDDVYAFQTVNDVGISVPANMPGVQSYGQEKEWHGLHIVRFLPGIPQSWKEGQINDFRNNPDFECEFDVVTPYPNLDHTQDKWRIVDHLMLVTFQNPALSTAEIDSFMSRWELVKYSGPPSNLPAQARWPYSFKNIHTERCGSRKTIDIVREIMIEDSAMVEFAEPNILNLMIPHSNDPKFGEMWHVKNTAQIISNHLPGLSDADCDIEEAWNKGFTGAGINIAVIDYHGYDTLHEDMRNTYLEGYNAVDTTIGVFDVVLDSLSWSHGHCVAGVVAANKDNQKGAAGVVPDAKVGAFLTTGSPVEVVDCFGRIFADGNNEYAIVNMSFGGYDTNVDGYNNLEAAIIQMATNGRDGDGIVLIASAGNDASTAIRYPASFPDVISIAATTPSDLLKTYLDPWDTIPFGFYGPWGSNYGLGVDFGAPGYAIPTVDLQDSIGYSFDDYTLFNRTSAAAPIASGIAAMILQANPNIPFRGAGSVFDFMKMGAERVGGYNYYAYWPNMQDTGRSAEIGYGRLNACNSLNLVAMEEEVEAFRAGFKVAHLQSGEVRVYYDIRQLGGRFDLEIIDLNGTVLKSLEVPRGEFWFRLPTHNLPAGMYLARLRGSKNNYSDTEKFFIFR